MRNLPILILTSAFFVILLSPTVLSRPDYTLTVKLTLPDDYLSVRTPDGLVDSDSSGTWTAPSHYYLSSHGNGLVRALVHSYQNPLSLSLEGPGDTHTLGVEQGLENSRVFLVFTEGDWKTVEERMPLVESSAFLSAVSPSFCCGLGFKHPIKIVWAFHPIDLDSDLSLSRGRHELGFTNLGTLDDRNRLHPEPV